VNVADFDAWRERYDEMTYQEMKDFYNRVEMEHPLQQAFNAEAFSRFLAYVINAIGPIAVLEIGGWKGELAHRILSKTGVIKWHNYEICESAVRQTISLSPHISPTEWYRPIVPGDFVWNITLPEASVLVASHFIEHIKQRELAILIGNLPDTIQFVGLQAPIPEFGYDIDWAGYHGTHILEVGWKQVSDLLLRYRFMEISTLRDGDFRAFRRAV